jgi:hypothetical protein
VWLLAACSQVEDIGPVSFCGAAPRVKGRVPPNRAAAAMAAGVAASTTAASKKVL